MPFQIAVFAMQLPANYAPQACMLTMSMESSHSVAPLAPFKAPMLITPRWPVNTASPIASYVPMLLTAIDAMQLISS